MTLWIIKVILH